VAEKETLIVITGPTCSGKTSCALELGRIFPVEVISADSMQVYRYMDIATAKPTPEERRAVPHHLVDVVNPDEEFNAARFVRMAMRALEDIRSRGKIPMVVGGTGLYVKALVHGLLEAPGCSPPLRLALKQVARKRGLSFLREMLERLDPVCAARILPNDEIRLVRYLEIVLSTGRRPSELMHLHRSSPALFDAKVACIVPERERLYNSISARTGVMFDRGLVEETKRLLSMGYDPSLRTMQTLAYKHVVSYVAGSIGLDECRFLVERDTKRFAKRQLTWIRSQEGNVCLPDASEAFDTVARWIAEERVSP